MTKPVDPSHSFRKAAYLSTRMCDKQIPTLVGSCQLPKFGWIHGRLIHYGSVTSSATQVFRESDRMKLYPDDWRVRLTGAAGDYQEFALHHFKDELRRYGRLGLANFPNH